MQRDPGTHIQGSRACTRSKWLGIHRGPCIQKNSFMRSRLLGLRLSSLKLSSLRVSTLRLQESLCCLARVCNMSLELLIATIIFCVWQAHFLSGSIYSFATFLATSKVICLACSLMRASKFLFIASACFR